MSEAAPAVNASRAPLAYAGEESHRLVTELLQLSCGALGVAPDACTLDVDARDHTFHWSLDQHHQHRGQALVTYFRSGLLGADTVLSLLAWRFGASAATRRVLDFAAGYGRIARFLQPRLAALEAADIDREAVAFLRERLGLRSHLSFSDPARFEVDGSYDLVWAASLFSHLPEHRFGAWLARLWELLGDGGVLAFSTLDLALHSRHGELTDRRLVFEPVREIEALPLEEYGTTWTRPELVQQSIETHCPGGGCWRRARGLWSFQDLWVVTRGSVGRSQAEADPFRTLPAGCDGRLESSLPCGPGRYRLSGWAVDRDGAAPAMVRVLVDGEELARCSADQPRADVATALGGRFEHSGFSLDLAAPAGGFASDATLCLLAGNEVEVRPASVLHLSQLEGADLVLRASGGLEEVRRENLHLRAEVQRLQERISWMESSRFWKLRQLWWRLRG